jgi:hypothetical protein
MGASATEALTDVGQRYLRLTTPVTASVTTLGLFLPMPPLPPDQKFSPPAGCCLLTASGTGTS